jgi:D-alanyl-D-alanine carboxypeptidase
MKISNLILPALILVAAACSKPHHDDPYVPVKDQIGMNLQSMVTGLETAYRTKYPGFPGGLALKVITGKGEWYVSSGMPAGTGGDLHFRTASVTKTFTATAILLLAQEGKLRVTDRITDTIPGTKMTYLPDDENYAIPYRNLITIRQLLQNKAGVFDIPNDDIPDTVTVPVPYKGQNYLDWTLHGNPLHTFTFDELAGVVAKCRLFYFIPGTGYHYSNTGFSLLGKIIERVSGQSYGEYVTEHILRPMGMSQSSLPYLGSDTTLPAPFAPGYLYLPQVSEVTYQNMSANVAEGNLITTPDDLARFARHLFRGQGVLSSYTVNMVMLTPLMPPDTVQHYVCGAEYYRNLGYGHGGNHPGYNSLMVSDPVNDFTCVVFINAWNVTKPGSTGIIEQVTDVIYESAYHAQHIVLSYKK